MHPVQRHNNNVVSPRLAMMVAGMATVVAACSADIGDDEEVGNNQAGFEAFEGTVYQEAQSGVYIVNGDTPVVDIKHLQEFWEGYVREGALLVNTSGGADVIWTSAQRHAITYCVSTSFGSNYNAVVTAMAQATGAWEAVTDVDFVYHSEFDGSCTASNSNVVFDVNPVNSGGQYIARAFFPGQGRSTRNVLIDGSAFTSSGNPTVTGVLRHELGHTLGFRHEHTRPESGTCFEDNNWRALTTYDSASVMHYPQCNGTGDWSLSLTAKDIQGAVALYGAPTGGGGGTGGTGGGGGGTGGTGGSGGSGGGTTENFTGTVARNAFVTVGPSAGFDVTAGTPLTVNMTGTGDADLYVKFGSAPTTSSYACRPYLSNSNEVCTLDVPAGVTKAFVKVQGYATSSTYNINVTHTGSSTGGGSGTATSTSFSSSLATGATANHGPLAVVPGSTFTAVMSGTGDPDLFVKFGSQPTASSFDCRPYLDGAAETCTLTVPAGQSQAFIQVNGYTASTYRVDVNYTTP